MLRSVSAKLAEIDRLMKQVDKIQGRCLHPPEVLKKEYGGNSGYDYDLFWANFTCMRCGKVWTAYDDEPDYNRKADL